MVGPIENRHSGCSFVCSDNEKEVLRASLYTERAMVADDTRVTFYFKDGENVLDLDPCLNAGTA